MNRERNELAGFRPGGAVRGTIAVPGSKSIAQRALVLSALCGGETRIAGLPDGDDVRAAIAAIEAAGARVERLAPAAVRVSGRPPGPHRGWRPEAGLDVGESGTLARLATAAVALCGQGGCEYEVRVRGTLAGRSSRALFAALRAAGVRLDSPGRVSADAPANGWPVRIWPVGPPSTLRIDDPVSSQEVSALLIALAAYPDALHLVVCGTIPSRPYLEMTRGALAEFGVRVESSRAGDLETFEVRGPLRAPETPLTIEPDASAAAVALAAACLSGGDVTVAGLTVRSRQGDVRIVEHLRAFGCDARADDLGLHAHGAPQHGARLDLSGEPDLAPVIAAVAARAALDLTDASGTTHLTGLGTLPGKESSRIEVLAEGLREIGLEAEATRDTLTISRSASRLARVDVILDPRGDHRMAFAFALFGLTVDSVRIRDPHCVAKSWPGFWNALERAGAALAS